MDTIRYLALGDSLSFGYGVDPKDSFPERFANKLREQFDSEIVLWNEGVIGATASEAAALLASGEQIVNRVREADLITITLGGNDLLHAAQQHFLTQERELFAKAMKTYVTAMRDILSQITSLKLKEGKPYAIRLIGLYNPFEQFEEAVYWVSRLNRHLRRLEKPHVRYVDLYEPFSASIDQWLGEDFVHPNEAGYSLMAEQAAASGIFPLEK